MIKKLQYVVVAAMFIFLILMFTARPSDRSFVEVASGLEQRLDLSDMKKQSDQVFKRDFGLNPADYEGVLLYQSEENLSVKEILLVQVSDASELTALEETLRDNLNTKLKLYEKYAPVEAGRLKHARIQKRGTFLFMTVTDEPGKDVRAFRKSL